MKLTQMGFYALVKSFDDLGVLKQCNLYGQYKLRMNLKNYQEQLIEAVIIGWKLNFLNFFAALLISDSSKIYV